MTGKISDKLADIEDKLDRFVGDEIDPAKMERLNKMRDICREISEINSRIKYPFSAFDNRSVNAYVRLQFPLMMFIDNKDIIKRIEHLVSASDDMAIAILENGEAIQLSFGIRNMWNKFHYKN